MADSTPVGAGPIPLGRDPVRVLRGPSGPVASYVTDDEANLDPATVTAFGREWERFSDFTDAEIETGGREYFADLVSDDMLRDARVLDVGCGSGRWTRYFAARAAFVESADPGRAALVAAKATAALPNVRVIQAGVSSLPYPADSFDLVASVGVLHHVPDPADAIGRLAVLVRPGGWLYAYLYYRVEDRPWSYRAAFRASNALRRLVSGLPHPIKVVVCDVAAMTIYLPFVALATIVKRLSRAPRAHEHIPLHYYVGRPWKVIRNDALDRLGTPLERRFSKAEITEMLHRAGLRDLRFGDAMPRWRVVARKPLTSGTSSDRAFTSPRSQIAAHRIQGRAS